MVSLLLNDYGLAAVEDGENVDESIVDGQDVVVLAWLVGLLLHHKVS
jgi:hypothetical protein